MSDFGEDRSLTEDHKAAASKKPKSHAKTQRRKEKRVVKIRAKFIDLSG